MFQKQFCVLVSVGFLLCSSVSADDVVPSLVPINSVNGTGESTQMVPPTTQSESSVNTNTSPESPVTSFVAEKVQLFRPEYDPIVTLDGRFVLSSVKSYNTSSSSVGQCSLIARKNLDMLIRHLGNGHYRIFQGDAAELIAYGLINKTIQTFNDRASLMATLEERKNNHIETVFDAYRQNTNSLTMERPDERGRGFFMQGHRAVIFLGDDEQWYILDPIDGAKTIEPQLLSTYLPEHFDTKQWFLRVPGYTFVDVVTTDEFHEILPFLSSELQLLFTSGQEYVTLRDESGYIISGAENNLLDIQDLQGIVL